MATQKARTTRTAKAAGSKAADKAAAPKAAAAKAPATRKAPAKRKAVPKPADPGTAKVKAAKAAKTAAAKAGTDASKVEMVRGFRPTLPGYSAFPGHDLQSAFTLAALVASGMATMVRGKILTRREGGHPRFFYAVINSPRMKQYHTAIGNFDKQGYLTAKGVNHFHGRLDGNASWGKHTVAETVMRIAEAVKKGGTVEVEYNGGKRKIAFDAEVAVSK